MRCLGHCVIVAECEFAAVQDSATGAQQQVREHGDLAERSTASEDGPFNVLPGADHSVGRTAYHGLPVEELRVPSIEDEKGHLTDSQLRRGSQLLFEI